ncbi:hypothetical protein ACFHYQ_00400 [Sphaerimonospora cavernae]|uniref:Uncharacterized protein n=1 Tax=Sphaerimonospora cavernae TaxID=1740611 RepID=A0ABV6TX35_9ACTN
MAAGLAALDPAALDPAALDPAALDPAALDPAALDVVAAPSAPTVPPQAVNANRTKTRASFLGIRSLQLCKN